MNVSEFESDDYPSRPRILFVGNSISSHTHGWIDLVRDRFNVRLFAIDRSVLKPPDDWPVRTYITSPYVRDELNSSNRQRSATTQTGVGRLAQRVYLRTNPTAPDAGWLAQIIERWQPHIIHTLAMNPSGLFYDDVRRRFDSARVGKWVLQLWGGSDLHELDRDPKLMGRVKAALEGCDQLLSDNAFNFEISASLGVDVSEKVMGLGIAPGAGGVDVDGLSVMATIPPAERRLILWPKAYEARWSKSSPVIEAITQVWDRLQPCELVTLATDAQTKEKISAWPQSMRDHCRTEDRIPHARVIELMSRARVMLAPTLVDGVPNTLYEAMATGALPVVSPLATITPIVNDRENVLFAPNEDPVAIGAAMVDAMNDDDLVDNVSTKNAALVRQLADRPMIRSKVVEFYENQAD